MDYAFLRAVVSDAVCTQFLCMLLLLAPAAYKEHVFLDSFEEVSVAGGYDEIEGRMQRFLHTRDPHVKGQITGLAAARILRGSSDALSGFLFSTCHESVRNKDEWTPIAKGIAEEFLLSFPLPKGGDTRYKFSRVPFVVRVSIAASDGAFLDSFKELVEATAKMVRRDPLALDGQIALGILSAAFVTKNEDDNDDFSVANTSRSSLKPPDWLLQNRKRVFCGLEDCSSFMLVRATFGVYWGSHSPSSNVMKSFE